MVFESLNGQTSLQHNLTSPKTHTGFPKVSFQIRNLRRPAVHKTKTLSNNIFLAVFARDWASGRKMRVRCCDVGASPRWPQILNFKYWADQILSWLSNIELPFKYWAAIQILSWPNIDLKYWAYQILTLKYWADFQIDHNRGVVGTLPKVAGVVLSCIELFELFWVTLAGSTVSCF